MLASKLRAVTRTAARPMSSAVTGIQAREIIDRCGSLLALLLPFLCPKASITILAARGKARTRAPHTRRGSWVSGGWSYLMVTIAPLPIGRPPSCSPIPNGMNMPPLHMSRPSASALYKTLFPYNKHPALPTTHLHSPTAAATRRLRSTSRRATAHTRRLSRVGRPPARMSKSTSTNPSRCKAQ